MYDLNDDNFQIIAIKCYDRPYYTMEEYEEDISRISHIKRHINKYVNKGEVKERLLLNHIIIMANCFGPEFTTKALFLRISKNHWHILKTLLLYLSYLPDKIVSIDGKIINTREIPLDFTLVGRLRNI